MLASIGNPIEDFYFSRMLADRDVKPEALGVPAGALQTLEPNGDNATALIARYLAQDNLNRAIVEEHILNELNKII